MKKYCIVLFLFICGLFFQLAAKDPFAIVPVSYQGRFLPAESYANQWVYNFSHKSFVSINTLRDSLSLLWHLNFFGHEFIDQAPFFWIQKETRKLLNLNENEKNFSYEELKLSLSRQDTNLPLIKKMLLYHFSKAFLASGKRSGSTTLELTSLASNLWLKWNGHTLSVLSAPSGFPWQWITPNMIIADEVTFVALENSIKNKVIVEDAERLIADFLRYERLIGNHLPAEAAFEKQYYRLKRQALPTVFTSSDNISDELKTSYVIAGTLSSKEIAIQLEQQHPLSSRLANAGELIKALPGKFKSGEWYALKALEVKVFNPARGELELANNFTLYSDSLFSQIRESYFLLKEASINNNVDKIVEYNNQLSALLIEGYQSLSQTAYTTALGKKLYYPSFLQLEAESFYNTHPLTPFCIIGYALALFFFVIAALSSNRKFFDNLGFICILVAFISHTLLLSLRIFILNRPPVANMFETVLYVPWMAVLISLVLHLYYKNSILLIASSISSLILLSILSLNFYANSFENVQAVLDSHYWLFIHVLMVVGSYGLFLLSSLLGHLYLGGILYHKQETPILKLVSQLLLKLLYIGLIMLIAGTLLGGVWAAQSWGRFWDWDPKESWAFISICIYLLWIHAYRFVKIHHFGLAVGSILGFLAISFTWYGVNYILGTGLHSYGFGSGGTYYYYSYIFLELLFLAAVMQNRMRFKNANIG